MAVLNLIITRSFCNGQKRKEISFLFYAHRSPIEENLHKAGKVHNTKKSGDVKSVLIAET